MEVKEIINEAIKIIRSFASSDCKIFLFGSWAKGKALQTSDIDIAILEKTEIPWETMVKIQENIDDIPTLRKIDIIDLNSTEIEFKEKVLSYAKML